MTVPPLSEIANQAIRFLGFKTALLLSMGAVPLLIYPGVLVAGIMSLSATQMGIASEFSTVVAKSFLIGSISYPLIYVASAIAALCLALGRHEALAVKVSAVPIVFIAGLGVLFAAWMLSEEKNSPLREVILRFGDVEYLQRWSNPDEQVFTPRGQEDLGQCSDQLTLNRYRSVQDEEGLASMAAAVLELHRSRGGAVLRNDSVPQGEQKSAEHRIVVVLATPHFSEVVFARFKLDQGTGSSAIYMHREYGGGNRNEMSAWLDANRTSAEQALDLFEFTGVFLEAALEGSSRKGTPPGSPPATP